MLRRVLDSLLALAARGWPQDRQADLVREWNAELYALEAEPGPPTWVRAWRRLWFAGSLVLARRTGFGGFAGRVSEVERMAWHAVALFCAPLVAAAPGLIAIGPITASHAGSSSPLAGTALVYGGAVRIVMAAGIGVLLAVHLLRRVGDRVVRVRWRLLALVPLLAGTIAVGTVPAQGMNLTDSFGGLESALIGVATLGVLLVPVVAVAATAAARVRSGVVRMVLLAPIATLLALASTAAVVWFSDDQPPWAAGRTWWWVGLLDGVQPGHYPLDDPFAAHPMEDVLARLPGVLLAAATVAVVYTVLISRTRPRPDRRRVRAVGVDVGPGLSPQPGRWWSGTLLAGAVYCIVAWALTLTYLTPHIGISTMHEQEILPPGLLEPWPGWSKEEGRLWMQDMQLYAIVCATLFFLCAAAYRGLPLFPGLAAAAVLLVADIVIVRLGLFRISVTPWLIGGSLLLGLLAWRYALRLSRANPTGGLRGHPLVAAVSVLAAFLIPTTHSGWTSQGVAPATPPALVLVVAGLPTLLAVLAAIGIVTTTRIPLPGPVWILPLSVGVVTAVMAVLRLNAPWPDEMVNGMSRVLVAWLGLATAFPLAAITCLLILGVLRNPLLLAAAAAGLFLLGTAVAWFCILGSMILARFLLAPMQYGHSYDGIAYLPGALVIGLLLAIRTRHYYMANRRNADRAETDA